MTELLKTIEECTGKTLVRAYIDGISVGLHFDDDTSYVLKNDDHECSYFVVVQDIYDYTCVHQGIITEKQYQTKMNQIKRKQDKDKKAKDKKKRHELYLELKQEFEG